MKYPYSVRIVVLCYLILLHGVLGYSLIKGNLASSIQDKMNVFRTHRELNDPCYKVTEQFYERVDKNVPPDSILFLGDSMIQGLCVTAVAPNSINFGIGNDTTSGVLERITHYRSIEKARVVVLAIGINDLLAGISDAEIASNYQAILDYIPPTTGLVCSAVLPIDEEIEMKSKGRRSNKNLVSLNYLLRITCQSRSGCCWIDSVCLADSKGNLKSAYHIGDGIHLNQKGYAVWVEELKEGVLKAQRHWNDNPVQAGQKK